MAVQEEAEDVYPRTPLPQEGLLASRRSTSLSHVTGKYTGEENKEAEPSMDPLVSSFSASLLVGCHL